jgi:ApbE superfamily uncharacterized protein (UPF0280 family)
MKFVERDYRDFTVTERFSPYRVTVRQTDLYVKTRSDTRDKALEAVRFYRGQIESYISRRPEFCRSLTPLEFDPQAPPIVQDMLRSARLAGVGPMAAVAGAIAEYVGRELLEVSPEVIVENGGDLFIAVEEPVVIGIFAGDSPCTNRIGVRIAPGDTPCGFCTSSATVGPSLSFGNADAASVWAESASLADAAATAVGNLVSTQDDLERAIEAAARIPGVKATLIVIQDRIGVWGPLDLVRLEGSNQ